MISSSLVHPLRGSPVNIGTILRQLQRPLCKDDACKSSSVSNSKPKQKLRNIRQTDDNHANQASHANNILEMHGSFLIRRQGGHPGVVLPLAISNSANH